MNILDTNLKCNDGFTNSRIAVPALSIVISIYIAGIIIGDYYREAIGSAVFVISIVASGPLIFLVPMLLSVGRREIIATKSGVSIYDSPYSIFSLVRKGAKKYKWEDIIAWRDVAVLAGEHTENNRALELFTSKTESFKFKGKYFYINDKLVSYSDFKSALELYLAKAGENKLDEVELKDPLKIFKIVYAVLFTFVMVGVLVAFFSLFFTTEPTLKLFILVGVGLIVLVSLSRVIFKKNN